jgi:hypothetical protein
LSLARATGAFALLSAATVVLLSRDLRPPPLYRTLDAADGVRVVAGEPVSLECDVPRPPSGFVLPVWFSRPGIALRVRLLDGSGAERASVSLDEAALGGSDVAVAAFSPGADGPRRIRLEFSSDAAAPRHAPELDWSEWRPAGAAVVRRGDREVRNGGPVLLLEYPWPSRNALWLWLLVIPAALVALRDERRFPVLLVVVSLVAMTTSVLLWQRDYVRWFSHWDADEFGAYATALARWLTTPATRAAEVEWMRRYIHAQNPLGPALMAVPIALGLPAHVAYLGFSAWCSFASLLVLFALLRRRLGISYPVSAGVALLCASHLVFLRSFARPVTDALGHLLTAGSLALLVSRAVAPAPRQRGALAALNLLHPLARPQGVACIPFVTLAVVLLDRRRPGARSGALGAVVELLVVPLAILGALYWWFGWWQNAAALVVATKGFATWFSGPDFAWSLVATAQLLPLLWVARWRSALDVPAALLLGWIAYYLAVLVAVRAPFWARHFLPLLPALLTLGALGVDAMGRRARTLAVAGLLVLAAANVAAVVHFICDRSNLSLRLLPAFSLG